MVLEDKDNKLEKTETKNNFDAKFTEFQKIPKTDYSNLGKDLTKNLDKGPDGKPVPFMKQLEKFRAEEAENAKKTNEAVKENPISADLSGLIDMLGEGTDQSTKNLTKEIARSLTAEAQKLFTIDKNQATGEIAKNINSKMSWLQDVFVNEKDLANNIVDMAQTSIDGYMNTERINAMVIAMIYNIMERMHSDLQAKGILENKDPASKWNVEKIKYLRNFQNKVTGPGGKEALLSIGMNADTFKNNISNIKQGIYQDINAFIDSQDNPRKKIKDKDPGLQSGFDNIIGRHLSQIADTDTAASITKMRTIGGIPLETTTVQSGDVNNVIKGRWSDLIKGVPQSAADQLEATKLIKSDLLTENKAKLEKFLSDLGMDKGVLKNMFFKNDGTPTTLGVLTAGLLNMTKSGNLDTLKKVFETQGQSTDKVKENTKKVVDTYTAEKAKSDYKATPISEIWPNETFGIKDEGFKNTFLSLDKKLLFITRKANNINYVPYAVAFKNANPTSVDANGTLKTDSETEKKFQEFILKDLATSIEKAHTDNAKIALPTDETSLVDAMTTVVQGGKLAESTSTSSASAPSTETTPENTKTT